MPVVRTQAAASGLLADAPTVRPLKVSEVTLPELVCFEVPLGRILHVE